MRRQFRTFDSQAKEEERLEIIKRKRTALKANFGGEKCVVHIAKDSE